jgi:hypothetical protein
MEEEKYQEQLLKLLTKILFWVEVEEFNQHCCYFTSQLT